MNANSVAIVNNLTVMLDIKMVAAYIIQNALSENDKVFQAIVILDNFIKQQNF